MDTQEMFEELQKLTEKAREAYEKVVGRGVKGLEATTTTEASAADAVAAAAASNTATAEDVTAVAAVAAKKIEDAPIAGVCLLFVCFIVRL